MSRIRALAFGLGTLTVLLDVAGVWLHSSTWFRVGPLMGDSSLVLHLVETPEPLVALFAIAGTIIVLRRPHNLVAWLLLAIGFFSGLFVFVRGYAIYVQLALGSSGGELACWMTTWTWFPAFALIPLLVLVFPDGRMPTPRWRPAAWLAVTSVAAGLVGFPFVPDRPGQVPTNLSCFDPSFTVAGPIVGLAMPLLLISGVLAIAAAVSRARQSDPVQRAQVKWFAMAVALVLVTVWARDFSPSGTASYRVLVVVVGLAVLTVPAAIAVAILRYRLWDIDRLVSRTVSYGLVTAVLVGVYLAVVFGFRQILPAESELAVAASTLAVAALFNPLRRRVQAAVDRRFNRADYDAAQTIDAFSDRLRSEVELPELRTDLREVVVSTVEPAHVSLWLRDETGR